MKKVFVVTATTALVCLWLGAIRVPAANEQGDGDVQVVRYSGKKITERSAQLHSIAGLPESELIGWTDRSKGDGFRTIRIGHIITGDEEGMYYELTLIENEGDLPQFKTFLQKVEGSHGSIAAEEQYVCELTLVDGVIAIQDWNPAKDGVTSGTIRGTLKLASSNGRIPQDCSEPRKIDIQFWTRSKNK